MLLSDIVSMLFAESGQYIIGNLDDIKLNMQGIWNSLQHEIYNYQRFVPLVKRFNIEVPEFFIYDFTFDQNNQGYSIGNAFTFTQTSSFPIGSSQVSLTFSNQNIEPGNVVVQFNGMDVATDATNPGYLTFSVDPDNYTGTIDYNAGTAVIYATDLSAANNGVEIQVTGTYVNPGTPPVEILGLVPVGTMQVISVLAYWMSPMVRDIYNPQRLTEPRMFLWQYNNNKLYYSETGWLDVTCSYDYQYIQQFNDPANPTCLTDVEIPYLELDTNFYVLKQILLGRFMQVIGRARRAFTFNDLPITTDAAELVREGTEIYNEARKLLYQAHDWSASVRPG
jgi:hypothetical protein